MLSVIGKALQTADVLRWFKAWRSRDVVRLSAELGKHTSVGLRDPQSNRRR